MEQQRPQVDDHGLLPDEQEVIRLIVGAYQAYLNLPVQHPTEQHDFADAVHTIQQLIALRVVRREYPDGWPTHNPET